MILVVGGTGQLGTVVVNKLVEAGKPVRVLVRKTSGYGHLMREGIEIVFGDLRNADSLDAACQNIEAVIATANAAVPREEGDSFKAVDDQGYENLINACLKQGVRRFVYTSVLSNPEYDRMPMPQQKRITEERLQKSGLEYTIFRADAFMDVVFPLMGSDIPLRNAEAPTVERPFWFSSRFFSSVKNNMAEKGEAGILGDGKTLRTYICIDDVAEFLVKAAVVHPPEARNAIFEIGGPEALSQKEVMAIYEKILAKPLKARQTPAIVFKLGYVLLKLFSPAAANIMGVNYCAATMDSVIEMKETARIFDVKLTKAEEFLRRKAKLKAGPS